jgi:tetratricopeptide (TPR) repeat protein
MKKLLMGLVIGLGLNPTAHAAQFAPQPVLPPGETVSVAELRVPTAAAKELRLSVERFDSGKLRESAKHLERAIRIDDRIPAAHNNLGVCYLRLQEYAKAASEFQKASALDSHLIAARISLSGALFILSRYPEAEQAARDAHDLDPTNPSARYLLGRILAVEGHDTSEVLKMLRASRAKFPAAHLVLASLLLKQKATSDAVSELREYLGRPDAPEKDKVACMIERLTEPTSNATCAMK